MAFQSYRSDPLVARYQGWSEMGEAEAAAFLRADAVRPRALQPGQWSQLGIAVPAADGSALIGDIGMWLSPSGDAAEFGISLASGQQRQGYAREALAGLLRLLAETTAVQRVLARTDTRNAPCLRLLEQLGMRHIGSASEIYKGESCMDEHFELDLQRPPT